MLEQPVGELLRGVALAAAVQRDAYAADLEMVGVGPGHGEVGAANHQLIEGGREAGQAFPRGRGFNGSELQRGLTLRRLPLADFYLDYMKSALQPGEFLRAIELPLPTPSETPQQALRLQVAFPSAAGAPLPSVPQWLPRAMRYSAYPTRHQVRESG